MTCIDNGMPLVMFRAADVGRTGYESVDELNADAELKARIERLRIACGHAMQLGDVTAKNYPKMTLIAAPRQGGSIATRSFIPHVCHDAIGVLAAVTVATACVLDGSVTQGIAVAARRQPEDDLGRASDRRIQRRDRARPGEPAERHPRRAAAHRAADDARRGDDARIGLDRRHAVIIDCHGHYTTAPKALEDWRNRQIAGINDPAAKPRASELNITDDELRETIEDNQLRKMQERGSDLTIFSPRASFMAHHIGDFDVSSTWAAICNELCYRVAGSSPTTSSRRRCCRSRPASTRPPASPNWRSASSSTATSASTSTRTLPAGTGPARRSPTGTGTRSTRRWSSTTSRR